jgi:phage gp46-like protein
MDFALAMTDSEIADMTYDEATNGNLYNNMYLSLMIPRGSFFQNPDIGSRLHLLKREKNTPRVEALAVEYCKEALAWMIDAGRVVSFEYETERDTTQNPGRMKIVITATKADGDVVTFTKYVEVV